MLKKLSLTVLGLILGSFLTVLLLRYFSDSLPIANRLLSPIGMQKPEVIGFLPYWLISQDENKYSDYLNNISYFSLTVGPDGKILKYTDPDQTETEPGWLALKSGKATSLLDEFKSKGHKRSLVVFGSNKENIDILMSDPVAHAKNLVSDISPVIDEHGFNDINIDIEDVVDASDSARASFTQFARTFYEEIKKKDQKITTSIDVSPIVLFRPYLTDLSAISQYFDKVIFMMYDFHFQNSSATGAVSPIGGGGKTAEFDVEVSVNEALRIMEPDKIVIGVPLYGYEWETLSADPNAGVIPGTGITASNKRVEALLEKCATCSARFDETNKESYVIYNDPETNTFHQIFYPDKQAMEEKIKLVKKYKLGGLALWALGYEGKNILTPLRSF